MVGGRDKTIIGINGHTDRRISRYEVTVSFRLEQVLGTTRARHATRTKRDIDSIRLAPPRNL